MKMCKFIFYKNKKGQLAAACTTKAARLLAKSSTAVIPRSASADTAPQL